MRPRSILPLHVNGHSDLIMSRKPFFYLVYYTAPCWLCMKLLLCAKRMRFLCGFFWQLNSFAHIALMSTLTQVHFNKSTFGTCNTPWPDRQTGGWMDGSTDRQMDGCRQWQYPFSLKGQRVIKGTVYHTITQFYHFHKCFYDYLFI